MFDIFNTIVAENTLGGILLAAFFVVLGIILKGAIANNGNVAVARINADVALGNKAIETLTTALEVLRDENQNLKNSVRQLESHMEQIIEYLLMMMKATSQEEADRAVKRLEQFLKSIGRWQY
jgi:predicted RNase H-like nuclease (RuvC/YqgF family)